MKKHAFTLAETLITLAIIGVVAALTIPTLIKKYEKHVIETGLKKTYSELSSLFQRSEAENGPFQEWDLNSRESAIQKYFAPYIHLKPCDAKKRPCFAQADQFNAWRKPNGDIESEGGKRTAAKYVLDDGRYIAIMTSYSAQWDSRDITIVLDVNGPRGKSIAGQDVFFFTKFYYLKGGRLYDKFDFGTPENGGSLSSPESSIRGTCLYNGSTCGYYIRKNNWKFPDDYPIEF